MSTYGPAAAKSQNDSAPWRWRSTEIARVSDRIPVTFEAAENDPIRRARPSVSISAASSRARSIRPSASSPIVITSAIDSRHGSSLLWCSYGPMNTTGRSLAGIRALSPYRSSREAGIRSSRTPTRRFTAPVMPDPAKITTWSSALAPTASRMIVRASSRNRLVWSPVPDDSVWVLAYSGRTASRR